MLRSTKTLTTMKFYDGHLILLPLTLTKLINVGTMLFQFQEAK